ncbi:hypothetical protein ILUMI_03268 [Ignelater luminosus]|uniref:Chitin-binding type-2 domain-containing protein n=1 Tax=Ignelater luminosus TaxID=2038154 RepID=A0A8K0DGV3_IGNLU|nr:hypothetical protein ILUMI_03268 [Ignelater luminosus]
MIMLHPAFQTKSMFLETYEEKANRNGILVFTNNIKVFFYVVSMLMCHPEQMFFCIKFTHYRSRINSTDLVNIPLEISHERNCDIERCSQVSADSPCVVHHCRLKASEFKNLETPWAFTHMKIKKKRCNTEPPISDCLPISPMVSQTVLEEWNDRYAKLDDNKWKTSYKTFYHLKQMSIRHRKTKIYVNYKKLSSANIIFSVVITIVTVKMTCVTTELIILKTYFVIIRRITTTTTVSTETPRSSTICASERVIITEVKKILSSRTLHASNTTESKDGSLMSKHFERPNYNNTNDIFWVLGCFIIHNLHFLFLFKFRKLCIVHVCFILLNSHGFAAKVKNSTFNYPHITCSHDIIHRKRNIIGTCQDYYECIQWRYGQYIWARRSCPQNEYFDSRFQLCRMLEIVECSVAPITKNNQKRWHNIILEQRRDIKFGD